MDDPVALLHKACVCGRECARVLGHLAQPGSLEVPAHTTTGEPLSHDV